MKNLCGNLSVEILDKDTNAHQRERFMIVFKMKTKILSYFQEERQRLMRRNIIRLATLSEANFLVPDWGIKSTTAKGCRNGLNPPVRD
jgi:hypothetical protein